MNCKIYGIINVYLHGIKGITMILNINIKRQLLFLFCLFTLISPILADDDTYNILFVQSYTPKTLWNDELVKGLKEGLALENIKAEVNVEYLDADYWTYQTEKEIMKRFCERARSRGTDLIVTSSDEAFHTLMNCGDSLGYELPLIFMGIKYPDNHLISNNDNVCGYISPANFTPILELAQQIFPERHEMVCVIDSSFLSTRGKEKLQNDWILFSKRYPHYSMKILNSQTVSTHRIIAAICDENNSYNSVLLVPKWTPFLSFFGRNSKAPLFTCQNIALKNGVFGSYDANSLSMAKDAGIQAAKIIKGKDPKDVGVSEYPSDFTFDYKQLEFFNVDKTKIKVGSLINIPFWTQYKVVLILFNVMLFILLITAIVWLLRAKKREALRRLHAQTKLIEQSYLISQRDEFDNIFHSIRDALVTYDIDGKLQITNKALLQMLQLPLDKTVRSYEGMPAGTLFRIYSNGKEILKQALDNVIKEGKNFILPADTFLKEVRNDNYFPISGELVPIRSKGKITGVAFSFRNVSEEEMQKHFFNLAVEDSSIFPWQYNIRTHCFTFPVGFLKNLGFADEVRIISRSELETLIYREDFENTRSLLFAVLAGKTEHARMNFRMRNSNME